jgi:hypothetical protein
MGGIYFVNVDLLVFKKALCFNVKSLALKGQ